MDTISPSWSILIFLAIVIVHGVLYSFGAAIQSISESDLEDKEDDSRTSKVRQMLEDSSKFTNALHIITIVMNVIVGAIIYKMYRDKKKGKSSCGCNCSSCPMANKCHK